MTSKLTEKEIDQKEAELKFIRTQNILSIISNFETTKDAAKTLGIKTNYLYQISSLSKTPAAKQLYLYKAASAKHCRDIEYLFNLPLGVLSENILKLNEHELTTLNQFSEHFDIEALAKVDGQPKAYHKEIPVPLLAFETRELVFKKIPKNVINKILNEDMLDVNEFLMPYAYRRPISLTINRAFILDYLRAAINDYYNKEFAAPTVKNVVHYLDIHNIKYKMDSKGHEIKIPQFGSEPKVKDVTQNSPKPTQDPNKVVVNIKSEPVLEPSLEHLELDLEDRTSQTNKIIETSEVIETDKVIDTTAPVTSSESTLKERAKSLIQNISKEEPMTKRPAEDLYCNIELFEELYMEEADLKKAKEVFNMKNIKIPTALLKKKKLNLENLASMIIPNNSMQPFLSKNSLAIIQLITDTASSENAIYVYFLNGELNVSKIKNLGEGKCQLAFSNKTNLIVYKEDFLVIAKVALAFNEYEL